MTGKKSLQNRKDDHIRINIKEDVESGYTNGLEFYALEHCALPDIDLDDVDTRCKFLGFDLEIPLIISSMTGGSKEGEKINCNLAEAAQRQGIALALGSQRPMLEHPELANSYKLRKVAPKIPIFGNIGAVQLNYGCSIDDCLRLVESVEANGLYLHLNPLQEALQPEGETNFSGLFEKIEMLCKRANFPVLVKEVGWGLSAGVAKKLINAGISVLDVAGAGGTSWSQVEAYRNSDKNMREIAFAFREWGISTARSIIEIRDTYKKIPLIASGGIRNGLEMAKCMALGADLCGMAGRLIKSAATSSEAVENEIELIKKEMRIAMFSTNSINLITLSKNKINQITNIK